MGPPALVPSAAAILNRENVPEPTRSRFSRVLGKGVSSLHALLSDLMSLARLEAGQDRRNGVVVTWQESAVPDSDQWVLCVQDTGPGFEAGSAPTLTRALKHATEESHEVAGRAETAGDATAPAEAAPALVSRSPAREPHDSQGEGIGLSIVKRLCELLEAGMELESAAGKGTTFRVMFPRTYSSPPS